MKYAFFKALIITFAAFFIVAAPFIYPAKREYIPAVSDSFSEKNVILLDAGHGGEDGGAVGKDGILEKDLNLSITLKTAAMFEFFGFKPEFTRKTDIMTCDEGLFTQRERKVSDIKNRLEQIEKSPCLFALSVHQNIYEGYARGAQVFFGVKNPESKILASVLQKGIISMLQPENSRTEKETSEDIYLLYHTTKPAVLIECGFISNSEDAALLSDDFYQKKLAFAIAVSSINYLTEREV